MGQAVHLRCSQVRLLQRMAENFILPNFISSNTLATFLFSPAGKLALGIGFAALLSHVWLSLISGPVFFSLGCTLELTEL